MTDKIMQKIKPRFENIFLIYLPILLAGATIVSFWEPAIEFLIPFAILLLVVLSLMGWVVTQWKAPPVAEGERPPTLTVVSVKACLISVFWLMLTLKCAAVEINQDYATLLQQSAILTFGFWVFIMFLSVQFERVRRQVTKPLLESVIRPVFGKAMRTVVGIGIPFFVKQGLLQVIILSLILNIYLIAQNLFGSLPDFEVGMLTSWKATLIFIAFTFAVFFSPVFQRFAHWQWQCGWGLGRILMLIWGILLFATFMGVSMKFPLPIYETQKGLVLFQFLWWVGMMPFFAAWQSAISEARTVSSAQPGSHRIAEAILMRFDALFKLERRQSLTLISIGTNLVVIGFVAWMQYAFATQIAWVLSFSAMSLIFAFLCSFSMLRFFSECIWRDLFSNHSAIEKRLLWQVTRGTMMLFVGFWGFYSIVGLNGAMKLLFPVGMVGLAALSFVLVRIAVDAMPDPITESAPEEIPVTAVVTEKDNS